MWLASMMRVSLSISRQSVIPNHLTASSIGNDTNVLADAKGGGIIHGLQSGPFQGRRGGYPRVGGVLSEYEYLSPYGIYKKGMNFSCFGGFCNSCGSGYGHHCS